MESSTGPDKQGSDESVRADYATRFAPGSTGNPAGRPKKGEAWTDILRELGELTYDELKAMERNLKSLPVKRAMAVRQLLDGFPGRRSAGQISVAGKIRQVTYERIDGKSVQPLRDDTDRADAADEYLDRMEEAYRQAEAAEREALNNGPDRS